MSGGNDALNTVVPHDGRYHDLRPQLGIPDDKLLALSGETAVGLHPALQPLVPMWDAHQLAVLPCVGFASDSRSHFASLDTWWSASPDHSLKTGWIGRWLDATGAAADNPLVAISLGGGAVPALASEHAQATAVNDLTAFRLLAPRGSDSAQRDEGVRGDGVAGIDRSARGPGAAVGDRGPTSGRRRCPRPAPTPRSKATTRTPPRRVRSRPV